MNRFAILALATLAAHARAQEQTSTPADVLPDSTVLYAEIVHPDRLAKTLADHPATKRFAQLEQVARGLQSEGFQKLLDTLRDIESQVDVPWDLIVEKAIGGGVALAFDARTRGAALVARATEAEVMGRLVHALLDLVRERANASGGPDPVRETTYRDVPVYRIGGAAIALAGPWLVATNNAMLGRDIVDRILDGSPSLADEESFRGARRRSMSDPDVWGYVDLETLRDAGVAQKIFEGKTDNILGELLIGGLFVHAAKAPYAAASARVIRERIRIQADVPHEAGWTEGPRRYFWGPDGRGAAPALLQAKDALLSVSLHRDISAMWLQAGDLFDDPVLDGMEKAESMLATLFSGKDFAEEILGALGPEVQLVAARQTFETPPIPAVKLPAFALVFRLKDPETMRPELRRIFQSLVGFLNVVGATEGNPQLDLETERMGEATLLAASFAPAKEEMDSKEARIHFNFSPTAAFDGDRFILSSTRSLARELVGASQVQSGEPANTNLTLDAGGLRRILEDNLSQLVAQNMLEKGHTRDEAEKEIGTLLSLLGMFKNASAKLAAQGDNLRFEGSLEFAEGK